MCPYHGRKYLKKEDGEVYCYAPTPDDKRPDPRFPHCMYHIPRPCVPVPEDIKERMRALFERLNEGEISGV